MMEQDPYVINSGRSSSAGSLRRRLGQQVKHQSQRQRSAKSHLHFSQVFLPRLVDRNFPYHQSRNQIAAKNVNTQSAVSKLLVKDWFHVFLRLHSVKSVTLLLVVWTAVILIFAVVYVKVDEKYLEYDCGLGDPGTPIRFGTSFAFSLETCTTVGYGLPGGNNGFFQNNCPSVQIAIYAQMTWSMMFNAFLLAFFFTKMANCENRSIQVVFADKLCVNVRDFTNDKVISDEGDEYASSHHDADEVYRNSGVCVNVRCYDIDSAYPVVEAHVRMYMIDKNLKLHVLRIMHPDDDMGSMLYTSLPTEIIHHVDHHSPLAPSKFNKPPFLAKSHGMPFRAIDSATGNRDEIICPVCGEAYGTYERFRKHVAYQKMVEEHDEYPVETSHRSLEVPIHIPTVTLDDVQQYMSQNMAEIIVVVEGIDPQVSGTFQALQSYKYDDIAWDGEFVQCLHIDQNKFSVCMEKFHQVKHLGSQSQPSSPDASFIAVPKEHKEDSDQMDLENADMERSNGNGDCNGKADFHVVSA
ncbi:unnamed protein product [Cylindrotheca closterium]|uniref:Inward rectifier potassium channel C-terminal domain-containing protein n=1 Tax=Cylindrotheca closterium TaxID=2856 RepID=A0AAD2FGG7_9STRA|nr:unnamed protein product [Cylindrotheca closterium]